MTTPNQSNPAAGISSTPANDTPEGTSVPLPSAPKGAAINRWIWRIAGGMAATLVVGFAGAIGGYYAALSIPIPNQVVIFNLDDITKKAISAAATRGVDPKIVADEILRESKAKFKAFKDSGIVVLDANSVLEAPDHLYIDLTDPVEIADKAKLSKGNSKDAKATLEQLEAQLKLLKQAQEK